MIPVNTPLFDGNEAKYLRECIDSGWISSEGPFVERFEREFAKVVDRKFGVSCSNGSAALDLAVTAAGIGPGDEVIMPTFTIISPAASVVRAGGIPVLVDCDPATWNMDVSQLEVKITQRTKAILIVHIYGLPVDMDPVLEIATRYGLTVIEDAAEMHGQSYRGSPCGSFGDISTFSFYANKNVTAGEGGMVVTNDAKIAEHCRSLRNLCFQSDRRFVHDELGWNYRMTNMQAAIGLAQLEQLEKHIKRKRQIGNAYMAALRGVSNLQLPLSETDYAESIYWVFGVVLTPAACRNARDVAIELGQAGVATRPFFYPMHLQPVFRRQGLFLETSLKCSEQISELGFYLPSGLGLQDSEIALAAATLREILS